MIKKNGFYIINIIIIIFVLLVYGTFQLSELSYYKEMAIDQARNDCRLTALDINSNLSEMASEQIVVSQMMANDRFIRQWVQDETGETNGPKVFQLTDYLNNYKYEYGFNDIFFVSHSTKNFYYDGGFNKKINSKNEYDSWYWNFLKKMEQSDAQVDTDELNDGRVSLYVNCLVQDQGFHTVGVIGVARNLDDYLRKIADYEEEYDVKICLVEVGLKSNSFDEDYGYYHKPESAAELMNLSVNQVAKPLSVGEDYDIFDNNICTNIVYNPDLKWNIVVQRDVSKTIKSILWRSYQRSIGVLIFVIFYIIITFTLMKRLNAIGRAAENTDELTGLYNNKIFKELYEKKYRHINSKDETCTLFMVDVDNFKEFNDNYGHLYGNSIIKLVASGLKEMVGNKGLVARWGGDEFIGVMRASEEETKLSLEELMDELKKADTNRLVTLSCGLVKLDKNFNMEMNLNMADKALYKSKSNGKGCCSIYEH